MRPGGNFCLFYTGEGMQSFCHCWKLTEGWSLREFFYMSNEDSLKEAKGFQGVWVVKNEDFYQG